MNSSGAYAALRAILDSDVDRLKEIEMSSADFGAILGDVRNNLAALNFFLPLIDPKEIEYSSDIFEGVKKIETFICYKRYGIEPRGLLPELVSEDTWEYLTAMRFTPATYCADCYVVARDADDVHIMCERCTDEVRGDTVNLPIEVD